MMELIQNILKRPSLFLFVLSAILLVVGASNEISFAQFKVVLSPSNERLAFFIMSLLLFSVGLYLEVTTFRFRQEQERFRRYSPKPIIPSEQSIEIPTVSRQEQEIFRRYTEKPRVPIQPDIEMPIVSSQPSIISPPFTDKMPVIEKKLVSNPSVFLRKGCGYLYYPWDQTYSWDQTQTYSWERTSLSKQKQIDYQSNKILLQPVRIKNTLFLFPSDFRGRANLEIPYVALSVYVCFENTSYQEEVEYDLEINKIEVRFLPEHKHDNNFGYSDPLKEYLLRSRLEKICLLGGAEINFPIRLKPRDIEYCEFQFVLYGCNELTEAQFAARLRQIYQKGEFLHTVKFNLEIFTSEGISQHESLVKISIRQVLDSYIDFWRENGKSKLI